MNKLLIAATISASAASLFAIQTLQVAKVKEITFALQQKTTNTLSRVHELNSAIEVIWKRIREYDSQTRSTTIASTLNTPSNTFAAKDPLPGDIAWNNGRSFVWIEKALLPTLGVPLTKPATRRDLGIFFNSLEVRRLLKEFYEQLKELPPEEYKAALKDVVPRVRAFATGKVSEEMLDQITTAMTNLRHADPTVPPYQMDARVAVLLGLSQEQARAAFGVFTDFITRFRRLERQNLEVLPGASVKTQGSLTNKLCLRIRPFPDQGETLKNELVSNLQTIIGTERVQFWMTMSTELFKNDLGSLGKVDRQLILLYNGTKHRTEEVIGKQRYISGGTDSYPFVSPTWRPFISTNDTGYEVVK